MIDREEKHIILSNLDEIKVVKEIGEGEMSTCYLTESGDVFKKFKPNSLIFFDWLRRLTGIQSDYIEFPDTLIYLGEYGREYLTGYFMRYVEGLKLNQLDGNTDIKELFSLFDKFEKEVKDLTIKYSLVLHDLHIENLLYTKDKSIKFIDTDFYMIDDYEEPYVNYRESMKELGLFLLPYFLESNNFKDEKLKEYYMHAISRGKMKPSFVLFETIDRLEKELNESVNTLDEFKMSIKLIKK